MANSVEGSTDKGVEQVRNRHENPNDSERELARTSSISSAQGLVPPRSRSDRQGCLGASIESILRRLTEDDGGGQATMPLLSRPNGQWSKHRLRPVPNNPRHCLVNPPRLGWSFAPASTSIECSKKGSLIHPPLSRTSQYKVTTIHSPNRYASNTVVNLIRSLNFRNRFVTSGRIP